MRKLFLSSIWAPNAVPSPEWKYRNLKRIMFPVIDFLFILAGVSAAINGVPAISEFYPGFMVDIFSVVLSTAALICFVGVSFPRLWWLEILGKTILFGLMVGYVLSLLILTAAGDPTRGFILLIAAASLAPIVWRLSLLGSEWQVRRLLFLKGE